MKPVTLTLPKIKIQKPKIKIERRVLVGGVIFALILLAIAGYVYLRQTGKLAGIDWKLFLAKFPIQLPKKEEKAIPTEEIKVEKIPEEAPAPLKTYEEKADPGEGITHLARKALKDYLKEKGTDLNLTPEHKIYIEDYLQNKTGERWLNLGETITFSQELIEEAISKAQQLSPEELNNLKKFSALVPSL